MLLFDLKTFVSTINSYASVASKKDYSLTERNFEAYKTKLVNELIIKVTGSENKVVYKVAKLNGKDDLKVLAFAVDKMKCYLNTDRNSRNTGIGQ
jgi:hypothetical protein